MNFCNAPLSGKKDILKNHVKIAENNASHALKNAKATLSDNKQNIAQACEKFLSKTTVVAKNMLCENLTSAGFNNELVKTVLDTVAKPHDMKQCGEQVACAFEKVGTAVIDKALNCVNNVKNPKDRGDLFKCTEVEDDWSVVNKVETLSVNPIEIAGLDQSCFLNINEAPFSKDLATVVIPVV